MKKLQGDIEILIVPVGIFLIVVMLMFVMVKVILDNIGSLNQKLSDNQKTELMLKQKLSSLQTVDAQVSNSTEISAIAMPGTNSVLNATSQIENQAALSNMTINNLTSDNIIKNPAALLNSTEIDFEADGDITSIAGFIAKIKSSTPLMRFDSMKINNQNQGTTNAYRLTAVLYSYWSPLPTTIPAITTAVENLTSDEQNILNQISTLQQLNSGNVSAASPSAVQVGKTNPFQ